MKHLMQIRTVSTFFLIFLITAGCATTTPAPTITLTASNTATQTLTPTATFTSTPTPKPTSTPNIAATQKYDITQKWLEKLINEGVISNADGKYYPQNDIKDSIANPGYYSWITFDSPQATNFILHARAKLDNATDENVFKSGCGFVFTDPFSNHAVFFSLDGNANYRTDSMDRGSKFIDASLYQNPEGVELTLILANKALLFYVNDQLGLSGITVYGEDFWLGPAILSGSAESFGTSCEFLEMAVWKIN